MYFDLKALLEGTEGIMHEFTIAKIGREDDPHKMTIYQTGNNIFTQKDGYIINNNRGNGTWLRTK